MENSVSYKQPSKYIIHFSMEQEKLYFDMENLPPDAKNWSKIEWVVAVNAPYVLIYPLSFVKEVTALPNKKSAKKRVLVTERNRIYNRFWKTRCKNAVKKLLDAVEQKDSELAAKRLNEAQGVLDKAVVKGVVHRNTASRRKAMIAARFKSLSA